MARQSASSPECDTVAAAQLAARAGALNHGQDASDNSLTAACRPLVSHGRDDTIAMAIALAPSPEARSSLQRAAECASERVTVRRYGQEVELALFAIPVVIECADTIGASQIEYALSTLQASALFPVHPGARISTAADPRLLSLFFQFEDLYRLPLSRIWQGAMALASNEPGWTPPLSPFTRRDGPMNRSQTFLRYLIGERVLREQESGSTPSGEESLGDAVGNAVQIEVQRRLGLKVTVHVFYNGQFHEALYEGMWTYQTLRLQQVVSGDLSRASDTAHEAHVGFVGEPQRFSAWVDLLTHQPRYDHAYTLDVRPGDPAAECGNRIARVLRGAGILGVTIDTTVRSTSEGPPHFRGLARGHRPALAI